MINALFTLIQTSETEKSFLIYWIIIGFFALAWILRVNWQQVIRGDQTWNNTFKYFIPLFTSNRQSIGSRIILELVRISSFVVCYWMVFELAPAAEFEEGQKLPSYIIVIGFPFYLSWMVGNLLYKKQVFNSTHSKALDDKVTKGKTIGELKKSSSKGYSQMTKSEIASEQRKDIRNLVIAVVVILAIIIYLNREQYFG